MPKTQSPLTKVTPLLVVDAIEPCLPTWEALGYAITVRVPEAGPLGFVILQSSVSELMLQTKDSLKEDLPDVAKRNPSALLYADVASLTEVKAGLKDAEVLVAQRKTFYGATESWLALPGGAILGLAEH